MRALAAFYSFRPREAGSSRDIELADIFHEVEEDLRRDRLAKLWQRYGVVFVSIAVVAVLATAAVVFWRQYQTRQAGAAAEAFLAVDTKASAGDVDGAIAAYGQLATEGGPYAELGALHQAGLLIAKSDVPAALAIYDRLMSSGSDDRVKAIARIGAARAVADSDPPDALKARVAPLAVDGNPWRYEAREIQAYADYRAKRIKEAHDAYAALAADTGAPETLRQRASQLASFMAGGGEPPTTSLPEPVAPPAEPPAPTPAPGGKKPVATPAEGPKGK